MLIYRKIEASATQLWQIKPSESLGIRTEFVDRSNSVDSSS